MKKKLIILGTVLALLLVLYGVDLAISKGYEVSAVSEEAMCGVADGSTPIFFQVRVTHGGKPVQGHTLYALTLRGGSFSSDRVVTDENGCAEFKYYPFLESAYLKAGDVPIQISDESNSLFVSVPAKTILHMQLMSPNGSGDSQFTTNDIFGD